MCDSTDIIRLASLFLFDPKDQFNAHIDAPAEERVIEKQAMLEGHSEGVPAKVTESKNIDHELVERV